MIPDTPRILLLSAYDAVSHRYWWRWLSETLNEYHWTCLPLPDRHFYWRVRSNAITYLSRHRDELERRYDLIVATSMTDLTTLRGLLPALSACPVIVYFHENQFAYPVSDNQNHRSNIVNAQLNSILTALSADKLVFNSEYNRTTFIAGVQSFIKRMPDGLNRDIPRLFEDNALTIPVPVNVERRTVTRLNPVREIVWNHRWEYDKQPEVFFTALYALDQAGVDFKLHIMGESFRKVPDCFMEAKQRLSHRISTWGHQSRASYCRILQQSDIVVSTAAHDFQGLSMLEAIHAGCVPVAPRRVAYPEYIPNELLYNPQREVESLTARLKALLTAKLPASPKVDGYLGEALCGKYRTLIESARQRNNIGRNE